MQLRNEWKYIINNSVRTDLEIKLDCVLNYDLNTNSEGFYNIKSLYFDDYFNNSFYDNDAGIRDRLKWRIRYYNNDLSYIKLEKKVKINDKGYKETCKLSLDEVDSIIKEDSQFLHSIIYDDKYDKLLKEFVLDIYLKNLKPKVIIDYRRKAYYDYNSDIRITIDDNLSSSNEINKYLLGNYFKRNLFIEDKNILEIKTNDALPDYLNDIFDKRLLNRSSFSKYFNGRNILNRI